MTDNGSRIVGLAAGLLVGLLSGGCGTGPADGGVDASPADAAELFEMRWVSIAGGSFDMGCSPVGSDCSAYEGPAHEVAIGAFEMTETEITQAQYAAVVSGEHESLFAGCANCPVDTVGWSEAVAFCEAVGGRLPTEAEWEYAARAGSGAAYACGDDSACLEDIAWYLDNAGDRTHSVKEKTANAFGLHDMLGNVWEWVEDCWHDDYAASPPVDGSAWTEDGCTYRVVRGGCWGLLAAGLRVTNRSGDYPDGYTIPAPGFRCAR